MKSILEKLQNTSSVKTAIALVEDEITKKLNLRKFTLFNNKDALGFFVGEASFSSSDEIYYPTFVKGNNLSDRERAHLAQVLSIFFNVNLKLFKTCEVLFNGSMINFLNIIESARASFILLNNGFQPIKSFLKETSIHGGITKHSEEFTKNLLYDIIDEYSYMDTEKTKLYKYCLYVCHREIIKNMLISKTTAEVLKLCEILVKEPSFISRLEYIL